ncbi:MAG TPA: FlgD immunoglobulin-like domain containing protein [Candidatus Krumholzibacteria bacterium]|nr:FlgD immunoglobulin-like domain containing protein [Candidatus Krumholzibacteria bacterium]HRX51991.1 FlgD immunoglobulin-like domain containing protein [Candidatus Krumholzibacteria bacterium]
MTPLTRIFRSAAVWLLAAVCLALAAPAGAALVTFDAEPLGMQYGAPPGDVPGSFMFTEDGVDLYVNEFFSGGSPFFNYAEIAAPFAGFGTGNILNVNNVGVLSVFPGPGDLSFRFLDMGGSVNIQVNGFGTVIEAPDFPSLGTFGVAPGVTMSTTWSSVGGGITGVVTLSGPVDKVQIGGQELWIEDLRQSDVTIDPCPYPVEYEALAVGTAWGGPYGNAPGDYLFSESGIDVYAAEFDAGSVLLFDRIQVDAGFGPLGADHILEVSNIDAVYDISPLGLTVNEVTFQYLDYGGTENLSVNGSALQIGDLHTFSGLTLGGVLVTVVTAPYGGGLYGQVTLSGNVQNFRVGGQEFWMDEICVEGEPTEPCDLMVDHSTLTVGDAWGSPYGDAPGDWMFTEDGIPVHIDQYQSVTGGFFFNFCEVTPALAGFGSGNAMNLNNVSNVYHIGATGYVTTEVTFEFLDLGGQENLQVNAAPRYVGELAAAPAAIAPGVTFSVITTPVPGGIRGKVTLTGDVQRLLVGGQEFWIDELCVKGTPPGGPVSWCDHLSDIESPALGSGWGGSYGSTEGDLMFVEDGMAARIYRYIDASGFGIFGDIRVDAAFPPFGSGQILSIANANAGYDLTGLGVTEQVRFEYFDGAGIENLQVNGATPYVGELNAAPALIAPGVTCTVYENIGAGFTYGTVVLEGDVDTFRIGGQQFAIDNVCARLDGSTSDVASAPAAVSLQPNYPNPFNPSTTLSFTLGAEGPVRLTVHDVSGRVVRTLIDEVRAAGPNQVIWDGRDERGTEAAAGVYFVRVESRQGVDAQKIALIK